MKYSVKQSSKKYSTFGDTKHNLYSVQFKKVFNFLSLWQIISIILFPIQSIHLQLLNLLEKSEEIYHRLRTERARRCAMSAMTRDLRLHGIVQMTTPLSLVLRPGNVTGELV